MKTTIFILITVILTIVGIKLIGCSEIIDDIQDAANNTPNNPDNPNNPDDPNNNELQVTITDSNGDPTSINGSITVTTADDINNLSVTPTSFSATASFDNNILTIEITNPDIVTITVTDNDPIIELNSTLTIDDNAGSITITKVVNNTDGSVTETVIEPDGRITVTITETDGTVTETITETDGTVTETVTEPSGDVTVTVTEPSGDVTVTATVTNPDGSVTVTVTEPSGDVTVTVSVTNTDGTISETITNPDSSTTYAIIDVDEQRYTCPDGSYIPTITANRLQDIALDKNYCIGKDIDLSSITNFDPIGSSTSPFTTTMEGNSKKITGLAINASADYIGLFAKIDTSAEIKNLIIENPSVIGQSYVGILAGESAGTIDNVGIKGDTGGIGYMLKGTAGKTGGLVGSNQGLIKNSYSEGRIDGNGNHTGGLVGKNANNITTGNKGTIESCYAIGYVNGELRTGGLVGENQGDITDSYTEVEITATEDAAGGLVGRHGNDTNIQGEDAIITKSYATGSVQASSHNWIGGLVGISYAAIRNSYSTGEVRGASGIGGLVGWNGNKNTTKKAIIENSYSTGQVVASGSNKGGLLGSNGGGTGYSGGIITNSYFDKTSTGRTNGIGLDKTGSQTATGYSSASGTVQNSTPADITETDLNNWDFSTIWTMNNGEWPTLQ